ncbi:MAG TPA: hypothetical protein VM598_05220 [Bdellovibrionota bacterium]|nr:hypothetical protein [Bdellovibrionota bacterium]
MSRNLGAIGAVLAIVFASGFMGCSPGDEAPFDIHNVSGDLFAGGNRQDRLSYLEGQLNLRVVIEDQGYANEFAVNRVLRQLAVNLQALKEQLKDVVELKIGSRFERREVSGGKLSLSVDAMASESAIGEFFSLSRQNQEVGSELRLTATRLGLRSIVDLRGMSAAEAKSTLEKLVAGLRGYDFSTPYASEFAGTIYIDRIFAVGKGSLVVPFDASEESYRGFVGKALDLARTMTRELEDASAMLTVQVSYQPSVLTPDEITAGLDNLKRNAALFLGSNRTRKPILIGRRTETDAGIATRAPQLLVSYRASPEEIGAALALLGTDATGVIRSLRAGTASLYQAYGIVFRVSDSDLIAGQAPNDGTVERVRGILDNVQRVFSPLRLSRVQVTEIGAASGGDSEIAAGSSGTASLRVALMSAPARMESVIARYEEAYVPSERMRIQRALLEDLRRFYASDFTVGYENALDASSEETTAVLTGAIEFFKRVATKERLRRANVRSITFQKGAISPRESVVIANGELKIDPYRATAEVLESAIRAAGG